MRISYQWLAEYFDQLPPSATVIEALSLHAFEVEDVQTVNGETTFEVKVLPDRAGDCLSHWGIAKEVAAILDLPAPARVISDLPAAFESGLKVVIADPKLGRRYLGRRMTGVKVGPSPDWLARRLESISQRAINNIVDATNFILFDLGQPLHAFDAKAVVGAITVRPAKAGETMTTLDGRQLALEPTMLVIADEAGPLALAGIKGGDRAQVTSETTEIIIEAANFDPVSIRQTATRLNLRTDASKRFENNPAPALAALGMAAVSELLLKLNPQGQLGEVVDEYPAPQPPRPIVLAAADFTAVIGAPVTLAEAEKYLTRLGLSPTTKGDELTVTPSPYRQDLLIKENVIEEVARLIGYNQLPSDLPAKLPPASQPDLFQLTQALKRELVGLGATEVCGYTFVGQGEVALENPLAGGKEFLRTELRTGLVKIITDNLDRLTFDDELALMFEVGSIFYHDQEELHLALGVGGKGKRVESKLTEIKQALSEKLSLPAVAGESLHVGQVSVWEIDLTSLVSTGTTWSTDLSDLINREVTYRDFSLYPRVIRDVALWVPMATEPAEVAQVISQTAGPLLVDQPILFDEFTKEERKSLAFRLIFQSFERTLTDEEVNKEMMKIFDVLAALPGAEVRD